MEASYVSSHKNDAWSYVNGELVKPEVVAIDAVSKAARKTWEKSNAKAKSDIILAIGSSDSSRLKAALLRGMFG